MARNIIKWTSTESEVSFRKKIELNLLRIWKYIYRISNKVTTLETLKLHKDEDIDAIIGEEEL